LAYWLSRIQGALASNPVITETKGRSATFRKKKVIILITEYFLLVHYHDNSNNSPISPRISPRKTRTGTFFSKAWGDAGKVLAVCLRRATTSLVGFNFVANFGKTGKKIPSQKPGKF
jgi:hypothetical protein